MFRAVVFDLDGTLVDSFTPIAASVNHVRSCRGLAPMPVKDIKRLVGRGARALMTDAVEVGDLEENLALYLAHHPTVIRDGTTLLPGAREALDFWRGQGARLAVCSNKPIAFTRQIMEHLGLAKLFSALIGPEDAGRPKPAPDMLLLALERVGVRTEEALYIGDMVVDVLTGRAAGVETWAVATGTESAEALRAAGASRVLLSLEEVTRQG
jgi:phosphoglycolate phosphatase